MMLQIKKSKEFLGCILTLPLLLISDLGDTIWTFYINQTYEVQYVEMVFH